MPCHALLCPRRPLSQRLNRCGCIQRGHALAPAACRWPRMGGTWHEALALNMPSGRHPFDPGRMPSPGGRIKITRPRRVVSSAAEEPRYAEKLNGYHRTVPELSVSIDAATRDIRTAAGRRQSRRITGSLSSGL